MENQTVQFNSNIYRLTNYPEPYSHGTDGELRFAAIGTDSEGNEVEIVWQTFYEWDLACEREHLLHLSDADSRSRIAEIDDELGIDKNHAPPSIDNEYACDWDNPYSVTYL